MVRDPFDNYMDLVEAARILGIHPQSLRRLIKQKKVPAVIFAGKYLIERDKLGLVRDAVVAGRAIKPIAERAGRHLPRERVLAPAGAEEQDIHAPTTSMAGRREADLAPITSTGTGSTPHRQRGLLMQVVFVSFG